MQLYYSPRNASWVVQMVLEVIGLDYQRVLVDRSSNQQKSADYLRLNPTGRIPVLVDGDRVLHESAAICLYLAEQHPECRLIPEAGNTARADFHQWLFYLTGSIQSELMLYFYPEAHGVPNAQAKQVICQQERRISERFAVLDRHLSDRNWLVGDGLTICDLFLVMLAFWSRKIEQPPQSYPALANHLRKLSKLPAVRAASELDEIELVELIG